MYINVKTCLIIYLLTSFFFFFFLIDAIALLGPGPPKTCGKIPCHMQISRQKQRPGSGCLSVMVLMDGPVRVLHISDIQKTVSYTIIFLLIGINYSYILHLTQSLVKCMKRKNK